MQLNKVNILNQGMSQDPSISKDEQKYAFENRNIRIQALDDNTLYSVTNVKGPKELVGTIEGTIVGKCFTEDYLVLFTVKKGNPNNLCYIYRITLGDTPDVYCLYEGTDLHFEPDRTFDTLYFNENKNVQKVYWIESWYSDKELEEKKLANSSHTYVNNPPRYINIITDTRYVDNCFDFYPTISSVPSFKVTKDYSMINELPAGVVQYFISYYFENGAETLIAGSSDTYTIDYQNKGGKADDTSLCGFNLTIDNIDTSFDYFRVYSAIRTSKNGPVTLKIVKDVPITKGQSNGYTLIDNGINQETLDATQLFFIGGNPMYASTLTQKDNTLFLGNIKTHEINVPDDLKNALAPSEGDKYECKGLTFTTKEIKQDVSNFSPYYNYGLQTQLPSSAYKTFKAGELYRFGVQFQSSKGQWTNVVWVGDKECTLYPKTNFNTNTLILNDVNYTFPGGVKELCEEYGFTNYRLVMADPETQNGRRILAQGIVCPTLFNLGQRILGTGYNLPSWVMRPRGSELSYHHFEPITSSLAERGGEIFGNDYGKIVLPSGVSLFDSLKYTPKDYPTPYYISDTPEENYNYVYTIIQLSVASGKRAILTINRIKSNNPLTDINKDSYSIECLSLNNNNIKTEKSYNESGSSGWMSLYKNLVKDFQDAGINTELVPNPNTLKRMGNNLQNNLYAEDLGDLLNPNNMSSYQDHKEELLLKGYRKLRPGNGYSLPTEVFTTNYNDQSTYYPLLGDYMPYMSIIEGSASTDKINDGKNHLSDYFVDESIVTFHSPDLPEQKEYNALFRIVGMVPINSTYADCEVLTSTNSFISNGGLDYVNVYNKRNIGSSLDTGLYSDYIYKDSWIKMESIGNDNEKMTTLSHTPSLYKMYLWDKRGSIIGATSLMYEHKDGMNEGLLEVPSELKTKTFFNQLHSFGNIYFDSNKTNSDGEDAQETSISFTPSTITTVNGEDSVFIKTKNNTLLYNSNYDNMHAVQDAFNLNISNKELHVEPKINSTVRIKFNSTPHAVFDLNGKDRTVKKLLPIFNDESTFRGSITYKDSKTHDWKSDGQNESLNAYWLTNEDIYKGEYYFTIENVTNSTNVKQTIKDKIEKRCSIISIAPDGSPILPSLNKVLTTEDKILVGAVKLIDSTSEERKDALNEVFSFPDPNNVKYEISFYFVNRTKIIQDPLKIQVEVRDDEIDYSVIKDYQMTFENTLSYGIFKYDNTKNILIKEGFPIKYETDILYGGAPDKYLFIGELYSDLKAEELYNGYDYIDKLVWYPISKTVSINEDIKHADGDTYYQRWDCLKTYPATEEDVNKVVDITSFMVETHRNLDERTDNNRGSYNIMSRPENFNQFNPVYDNVPNIFQYTTDTNNLGTTEYPNQIVWSLTKNYLGSVDTWTNINLSAITASKYPVTKLTFFNNNVVALTEHSVDVVNFNARSLVPTEDNSFIEIQNGKKTDGMITVNPHYGTHNQSILITERGLYFVDDNSKSINRFNLDGNITILASNKMLHWMHNNITQGTFTSENTNPFHLEYDPIHKDVYIINEQECLIYNEGLEAFTSFMDYQDCYTLNSVNGDLYSIGFIKTPKIYKMFEGYYNRTFGDIPVEYSVQYRINPNPYSDKVFTNVEFIADYTNNVGKVVDGKTPFDKIQVWNEYQDTTLVPLEYLRNSPSSLKQKFRTWRANIPRNGGYILGADRIRNPWIYMKLKKEKDDNNIDKMQLHSMNVQYMM